MTDIWAHSRYLHGIFGALDQVNESGEFKDKAIPDLAKEILIAKTVGSMVNLSCQTIVNDDMGIPSSLAVDLGRAANPCRSSSTSRLDRLHHGTTSRPQRPHPLAWSSNWMKEKP